MDQANGVYAEDYKALQEKLKHYPGIQIESVEKDPPEQYVIEYKVFGYAYAEDGSVQMGRRHKIEINLPFGYPHFPPTVKPITRVCHPDVDENAVRIADYWQNNQSLADLVIHIAHMLRGQVYSTDGVFNPEAASWYEENKNKLPLSELEYVHDPDAAKVESGGGGNGIPVKSIAVVSVLAVLVVGGGILYRDFDLLKKSNVENLDQLMEDRKFDLVNETITKARDSLASVIILGSSKDKRLAELNALLESPRLQEGLKGRVEYGGGYVTFKVAEALRHIEKLIPLAVEIAEKGDLKSAVSYFADAMRLAEENNLPEVTREIRKISVTNRLDYYLGLANNEYAFNGWEAAGGYYERVVAILKQDKDFLSPEQAASHEKIEKLRVLAMANFHNEEAARLERAGNFKESAEHYKAIASIVERSDYPQDPVLVKLYDESVKEASRVEERVLITAGREYLLNNFKQIFKKHYPGVHGPALQSPRLKYIGRSNENNLVFLMSCIELIQRSSNEYRLYYQHNPVSGEWSIYREKK